MNDRSRVTFDGTSSFAGGLTAVVIIALVALGCTCNKSLDLANLTGSQTNTSSDKSEPSKSSGSNDREGSVDSVPSNAVVEGLVKETLEKFTDAIDTKDFAELYASSSEDFRKTYSLDEMTRFFKSYTDKRSVVVPILRKVDRTDATFTRDPSLRTEKGLSILMAAGEFKTKPYKVRFDFEYVMRGGEWKLLKLVINVP